MRKYRTEDLFATHDHLKAQGFKVSDLCEHNDEIIDYMDKHIVVKEFPQFTVECLIVDGKYIAGCQYGGNNWREVTPAQFEQARHQIGL